MGLQLLFHKNFSQAKNSCSNQVISYSHAFKASEAHLRAFFYDIKVIYPMIVNNFCFIKKFSQARMSCSNQVISYSHASTASELHCRESLCNIKIVVRLLFESESI